MQEEFTDKTELLRDFGWRLTSRAEKQGLSQSEVAGRLGVTPSRVGNWFQGRHMPLKRERQQLAKLLGTSVDWLLTGTGPVEVLNEEAGEYPAGAILVREVPVISWTHAGTAANYAELPKHFQGAVATQSRDKKAFALKIEGESMLPDFKPGDCVVLEPNTEPRNGKTVVAKFVDEAVQLRIYTKLTDGRIQLASLRPEIYPTQVYSRDHFDWIYHVAQLVRNV